MESKSDPASGRSGLIRWIKLNFFFQKRAQRILESIIRLSKLREMKYEKVVKLVRNDGIEASCYCVAVDAGFEKAKNVSRFLSTFYNTTFTKLKTELLKEDTRIDFLWLNSSRK